MKEKQRKADVSIFVKQVMVCLHNFQLFWSFQLVETHKYWRSIFLVPCCKTLLTSKTVRYFLLNVLHAPPADLSRCLKNRLMRRFGPVGSLLQCFRVKISAQIFRPDSGLVRPLPLLQLVAHLLITVTPTH